MERQVTSPLWTYGDYSPRRPAALLNSGRLIEVGHCQIDRRNLSHSPVFQRLGKAEKVVFGGPEGPSLFVEGTSSIARLCCSSSFRHVHSTAGSLEMQTQLFLLVSAAIAPSVFHFPHEKTVNRLPLRLQLVASFNTLGTVHYFFLTKRMRTVPLNL